MPLPPHSERTTYQKRLPFTKGGGRASEPIALQESEGHVVFRDLLHWFSVIAASTQGK